MNVNHKLSQKTFGERHVRQHRPMEAATKKLGRGSLTKQDYAVCKLWRSGKES